MDTASGTVYHKSAKFPIFPKAEKPSNYSAPGEFFCEAFVKDSDQWKRMVTNIDTPVSSFSCSSFARWTTFDDGHHHPSAQPYTAMGDHVGRNRGRCWRDLNRRRSREKVDTATMTTCLAVQRFLFKNQNKPRTRSRSSTVNHSSLAISHDPAHDP